jgi:hypothetical protein
MATLNVPDHLLKVFRETLCRAQSNIAQRAYDRFAVSNDIAHVQHLIEEIDIHRPLGQDGKHGDLHTPTCGCDDIRRRPLDELRGPA